MPNLVDASGRIAPWSDLDLANTNWQIDDHGRIVPKDGTSGDSVLDLGGGVICLGPNPFGTGGFGSFGEF